LASIHSEDDAITHLETVVETQQWSFNKDDGGKIIGVAMERGWWRFSEKFVDTARESGVDLTAKIHSSASRIRRKLQGLADSLQARKAAAPIAPAFQWAQSPGSIFLNVKFAHKMDTPATLGCVEESVEYGSRSLDFVVKCDSKKKKFSLHLEFLHEIDAEACTWSMASVGRAMVTLVKKHEAIWPRLLKSSKKPGNMHVWWSMREQHEDEIKDWEKGRKAAARKATESAAADKGQDTTTGAAEPTPIPSPTPAPTPTPVTVREVFEKALQEVFDKHESSLRRKEKAAVSSAEAEGRRRKKEIDDTARAQKSGVDADVSSKKKHAAESLQLELGRSKALLATELAAATDTAGSDPATDNDHTTAAAAAKRFASLLHEDQATSGTAPAADLGGSRDDSEL
jgi:hypothetical protein